MARWLAGTLNGNVILVGNIAIMEKNAVEITARFLSVKDEKRIGPCRRGVRAQPHRCRGS